MDQTRSAQRRNRLRVVGARIAIGAAWGALPGGAAVAAGVDGNVTLAALLGVVAGIAAVVIPLAPFLPFLNRLPLVGSPQLEVVLRLNGRRDLTLTVAAEEEHACILEVEVSNPNRWFAVKEAWLGLSIPSGIKIGRCNQVGQQESGGKWKDFHAHAMGSHSRSDYWHDTGWTFPARFTEQIRFKLRLGTYEPDLEYPVMFTLSAPSLYKNIEVGGTIKVRVGEQDLAHKMGKLIADGERTLEQVQAVAILPGQEKEQRVAAMAFAAAVAEVLTPAISDNPLPQTPADADASTYAERVQTHLTALYVVRDERGREAG